MHLTLSRLQTLERGLITGSLVLLTLLAWSYLVTMGSGQDMPMPPAPAAPILALNVLMWVVMMVAMMVPSATPMILTFVQTQRRLNTGRTVTLAGAVIAGYLSVWFGFALIAALSQWGLYRSALLSSAMGQVSPALGGSLLFAAGLFQFTPLKQACLVQCQSPLGFFMTHWQSGHGGAFRMGFRHGAYCTGCCWALMALMFVGGVMNLAWMAALTCYFLLEKLLPRQHWLSHATGAVLILASLVLLSRGL